MTTQPNKILALGAFLVLLSIVFGAFGAHSLKNTLGANEYQLGIFKTGVEYQLYHGFGIMILAMVKNLYDINIKPSLYLFLVGLLLFSGSLYGLCFASINNYSVKLLGPLTPIGGLCFIIGWALFIYRIWNVKK
jgi:uncharacterized membrane protein YgdD (TMEM256/DUF423 family)